MSTKLETFVKMNKAELDSLQPSDMLWMKINAGIQTPVTIASKISWLKYFGYSASAIAVAVCITAALKGSDSNSVLAEIDPGKPATQVAVVVPDENKQNSETPETPKAGNFSIVPALLTNHTQTNEVTDPVVPKTPTTTPVSETNLVPSVPVTPASSSATAPENPRLNKSLAGLANIKKAENGTLNVDTLFDGVKHVELVISSCDVMVRPSNTDKVHFRANVTIERKGIVIGKSDYQVEYERNGDHLKINLGEQSGNKVCIVGSVNIQSQISLEVPQGIEVVVKNCYGNIDAKDISAKSTELKTSSGDMKVENMNGELKLSSGYGDIKAINLKGDLEVKLSSGDLHITNLVGNSELESTYGQIVLKEIVGDAKIHATSGDLSITTMKGNIDIRSTYGNVNFDGYEGDPDMIVSSGDIKGKDVTLRTGMKVKSTYGNIKMGLLNDYKDMSFDLKSDYGNIKLPDLGERSGEVLIKQGKILVKAYTASGDQTYK